MRRWIHLAIQVGCGVLLAACASVEDETGSGDNAAAAGRKHLVAVWVVDEAATVARADDASVKKDGKPLDSREAKRLRDTLRKLDAQIGLNPDGTFILKNRQADGHGIVTVEGNWSVSGLNVILESVRENGQPVTSPKQVNYTLNQGRLIRTDRDNDVVYPVFKKGMVP
jgi:hypothetical protein